MKIVIVAATLLFATTSAFAGCSSPVSVSGADTKNDARTSHINWVMVCLLNRLQVPQEESTYIMGQIDLAGGRQAGQKLSQRSCGIA